MDLNILLQAFIDIKDALTSDPSVWWILAPIFLLWIAMEMYFGEYKYEQLGTASAFANGISLAWVSVISIRFFVLDGGGAQDTEFLLLAFFFLYGFTVLVAAFRHSFSQRVIDWLAAPSIVYFFSTLAVLFGERLIAVNGANAFALFIIFIVAFFFFFLLKRRLGLRGEIEAVKRAGVKPPEHEKT